MRILSSYGLPDRSAVFSWFENGVAVIDRARTVQFIEILEKLENLDEGDFRRDDSILDRYLYGAYGTLPFGEEASPNG